MMTYWNDLEAILNMQRVGLVRFNPASIRSASSYVAGLIPLYQGQFGSNSDWPSQNESFVMTHSQ